MTTTTLHKPEAIVKCGQQSMVGHGPNGAQFVHRLFCHRWDCPVCGKKKAAKLYKALKTVEVKEAFTLVGYPQWHELNRIFSSFLRRLRYHHPGIRYLALFKCGQDRAEIVVFLNQSVASAGEINRAWLDFGGRSVERWDSYPSNGAVIQRATEFIQGMEPGETHSRMMRSSVKFFPEIKPQSKAGDDYEGWEWSWDPRSPESIALYLTERGYRVEWLTDNAFIALHPEPIWGSPGLGSGP